MAAIFEGCGIERGRLWIASRGTYSAVRVLSEPYLFPSDIPAAAADALRNRITARAKSTSASARGAMYDFVAFGAPQSRNGKRPSTLEI